MLHHRMHHLLVAVEAEVIPLRRNIGLGDAIALRSAWTVLLAAVTLRPAGQGIGQVVLGVLGLGQRLGWVTPSLPSSSRGWRLSSRLQPSASMS